MLGAAAAGVLMQPRFGYAKASQPATNVNFEVPAGACDCHTHIHGDPVKFPWFAGRTYTPEMALPEEMTALHNALKIQRVVIVTPSVYGPDNSATIYGMAARGKDARGVAVIDDKTTDAELDRLASLGFKGIRLNLSTAGINDPKVAIERFLTAAARVKSRDWHIQLNTTLPVIAAMKDARRIAGDAGVRSFRQCEGGAWGRATRLLRLAQPREIRQGLCQDFGHRGSARELRLFHAACPDADQC
jgi:hypothetical protein